MPRRKPLYRRLDGDWGELPAADWVGGGTDQIFLPNRFYCPVKFGLVTTQIATANQVWFIPWQIDEQVTFKSARGEVTTLLAGGAWRTALYTAGADKLPANLIPGSDVTALNGAAVGVQVANYGNFITLNPSLYWVAVQANAAFTYRAIQNTSGSAGWILGLNAAMGATPFISFLTATSPFGAFPATAPFINGSSTANPPLLLFAT